MSKADLKLDWCSHEAAKYAVTHWHYSKSLPTPPLVKVGVWESGKFIGCVLFSRGATQNIGKPYALEQTEIAELTRVALAVHQSATSRIVSLAIKFLKRQSDGLRLLVSYADPSEGHHGGIYQAMNWLYAGQMSATTEYIDPSGRRWHARMVSPTGKKKVYGKYRAVLRPDQCNAIKKAGKHKYLMPLDPEMRAQILPLSKPYPKRAGSADSGTGEHHSSGGGANPTPALNESNGK